MNKDVNTKREREKAVVSEMIALYCSCGSPMIKSWMEAFRQASSISASVASSFAIRRLLFMLSCKPGEHAAEYLCGGKPCAGHFR